MKDTDEPAFPVQGHMYGDRLGGQLFHGMTLRDYFAAQAMNGLVGLNTKWQEYEIAFVAYKMADAMLKARG